MKKKITALIFLFTLLATLQVHAVDYYLGGNFNNWGDYIQLTPNPNTQGEYYTKTPVYVNGSNNDYHWGQIIFKSSDGKYYKKDGNNTLKVTTEYWAKTSGTENIPTTLEKKKAYTFYFKPSDTQAKVYVAEAYDIVYLRGSMSSWTENQDAYKFSTTDGNEYTLEVASLDANTEFKVYNEVRDELSGDNELTVTGCEYTNNGGNIKLSTALTNVKLTYNKSAKTLTISSDSSSSSDSYCLKTSADNWGTTIALTDDDNDGIYSCTMTNPAEGLQFMVQKNGSDFLWPTSAVTYSGGEQIINLGTTEGNNITMGSGLSGKYTITLNPTAKTLTISGGSTPTPTYSYQLKGTIFDGSWQPKDMTKNDANGAWEWKGTVKKGEFGLNIMDGSTWKGWIWSADKSTISVAGVFSAVQQSGDNGKNWSSELEGEYTFSFDPENMKLTISGGEVSYDKYYVKYSSDSWNSHEMKRESNGTYTYKMTNPSSGCELAMQKNGTAEANDFWTDAENNTYTGGSMDFSMKNHDKSQSKNIKFGEGLSGDYLLTYNPNTETLTITGGEASHKPYYFVGDMNDWFSKEFTDPTAHIGMDKDVMNANKKNWEFTFINEIPDRGELGKGWYKFDFSAHGYECLTGQFQIFDGTDALWEGEVYSHNPYVSGYGNDGGKDHNSFKAYINRPISKTMISEGTVMTTTTTPGGNPAIRRSQGSNFHLGCNAVRNAKIYFKPGNDPRLIVSGTPEDYYIFYSKTNKTIDADNKVTAQIVNGKPNTNNYYLPGVKYDNVALPNYINEDGTTAAHMNMDGIDLVEFDFSAEKIETTFASDAFISMFNTASVGGMTLVDFKNNLKNNQKLPNGISLTGRTTVYVQKIPNGFEYPAGRKYALQFINAFSSSDKDVLTPVAASNLYFFNDAVHVHFNIDNYEKGAQEKNRFVKMYYRIYTYDKEYNTVVIDSDNGNTTKIHSKGEEIGLTAKSSTKDLGWVALNEKKAPSAWDGTVADTGHSDLAAWNVAWVSGNPGNRKHIDSKYGNCYIQFKVETGPNPSQASAANRANAEESDHGTLYIPERALIRNTPEFYTFNGQDLYVALDGGYTTTGVEDVFEDQIVEEGVDAEPIFFNLQGQRVVNPEKGMYIVVKGNKTYKVMIK